MKNTESVVYPRCLSNASAKSMLVMICLGTNFHDCQDYDSSEESFNVIQLDSESSVK